MFSAESLLSILQVGGFGLLLLCIPEVMRLTRGAVWIARGTPVKRMDFLERQYYLLLVAVILLTAYLNTMLPSRGDFSLGHQSWYAAWYSYGGLLLIFVSPVLLLFGRKAYVAAVEGNDDKIKRKANLAGLYFGLVAFFLWASCYLQLLSKTA